MADLIRQSPDPHKAIEPPRTRQERHPLSNKGWRWSHLIVAILAVYAVLFTAALGEWVASKTERHVEITNLHEYGGGFNASQDTDH